MILVDVRTDCAPLKIKGEEVVSYLHAYI